MFVFFFKQKTAYEMRISDWSSDVCSSDLCHASGHPSRLHRDLTNAFGSKDYAREELIAEMGSAFLCAALGIVPTVRHADYIASWLEVLREEIGRASCRERVCKYV